MKFQLKGIYRKCKKICSKAELFAASEGKSSRKLEYIAVKYISNLQQFCSFLHIIASTLNNKFSRS